MKTVKFTLNVMELFDRLTEEDKDACECFYIDKIEYDDDEIDVTVVVSDEN